MGNFSWQDLFTGVLGSIIATVLVAAAMIAIGFMKAHGAKIADPIVYGLAAGAFVAVLWMASTGHALFASTPVSVSNIGETVKNWAEDMSLGIGTSDGQGRLFGYALTTRGPFPVTVDVFALTGGSKFLQFQNLLNLSQEDLAKLATLKKMSRM